MDLEIITAASPPAPPDKISEEERLSVENIFLRLTNLKLQTDMWDAQKVDIDRKKVDAVRMMQDLQDQLRKKQSELSAKYGLPIGPGSVTPEGVIRPRPQAPLPGLSPVAQMGDTVSLHTIPASGNGVPVSALASAIAPSVTKVSV